MCFFIQSCEPLEKKKTQKKINQKKSTSFFHEPCVLPASPSSPSPHFSTDRNLTVANLPVLATQINIADLIFGIGARPVPCFFSTLEILGFSTALCLWSRVCHGLGYTSQPICSVVILALHCPGVTLLPTSAGCSEGSPRAGQWHYSWAIAKGISHQLPNGIPFPCPNTCAGWPLLPSVTLPCFAGAGVGVCNLLCITCTVSLSYLSTGCFS